MNQYRIAALILIGVTVLVVLPWVIMQIIPCSCNTYCPNKNSGYKVKDIPRPPACCPVNIPPCPSFPDIPPCPACGSSQPQYDQPQPQPLPEPQPPLDKSNTTTDLNSCSQTWELPPREPGYIIITGTTCFVPGTSLILEYPDTTSCENEKGNIGMILFGSTDSNGNYTNANSMRWDINFNTNTFNFNSGQGGWPSGNTNSLPNQWLSGQSNQVKFTYTSAFQIDVYINGVLIGSYSKQFPDALQAISFDASCKLPPTYAATHSI